MIQFRKSELADLCKTKTIAQISEELTNRFGEKVSLAAVRKALNNFNLEARNHRKYDYVDDTEETVTSPMPPSGEIKMGTDTSTNLINENSNNNI